MIPLFTSHFSIGKSILTLQHSDKETSDGPDSIFSIAKEIGLKNLFLVEESMTGFFEAFRISKELNIQLHFGYKFVCCNSDANVKSNHKLIAFAKNDAGCKALNQLYSFINTSQKGAISNDDLITHWSDDLMLAVPFYDSFIFNNQMIMGNCIPNITPLNPVFFIESNGLPFDELIKKAVNRYARDTMPDASIQLVQSIFYKHKSDCDAFQTFKILSNRKFGKQETLSCPNLDHFGSDEFCWESYMHKLETILNEP
jgi:DNA polymerase III alpha subunit